MTLLQVFWKRIGEGEVLKNIYCIYYMYTIDKMLSHRLSFMRIDKLEADFIFTWRCSQKKKIVGETKINPL